jgi:hypothetical protein
MKLSKKVRAPKGYSKGRNNDNDQFLRLGPIMIEDVMKEAGSYSKSDTSIREMMMRTDPTDDASPIIKRKFKPLDNPGRLLTLLQGILMIKEGLRGNNVTTGPNSYAFWRGCLVGTALTKFNELARNLGAETLVNLLQVERRLVTFFAPREVLREQTKYMRSHMRKPREVSTRQYAGAVATLNESLAKLPPAFADDQKLSDYDLRDIMSHKAPSSHKRLMIEQGFNPETATTAELVEICERAETQDAIQKRSARKSHSHDDDSSSEDERHHKKPYKKAKTTRPVRHEYYCTKHGPNSTHDTRECKVLRAERENKKENWKKRDTSEPKYSDYRQKYKKKSAELHLLQMETRKAKAKYTKAIKQLQTNENQSDASEGEMHDRKLKPVRETVREEQEVLEIDSSSSSSSSESDSEHE